jgi:hypothetical protein
MMMISMTLGIACGGMNITTKVSNRPAEVRMRPPLRHPSWRAGCGENHRAIPVGLRCLTASERWKTVKILHLIQAFFMLILLILDNKCCSC